MRLTKTPVETEIVCDDCNGQYMVMRVGWRHAMRGRRPAFYLRLKNEKIWIEEDWTQQGIASELERVGVAPDDIVPAFHAPTVCALPRSAG